MATRKKAAAKPAPAAPEFAEYVDKEPTTSTANMVEWLEEVTGYEVDATTVKLTRLLGGKWQQSDANQTRLAEAKAAREKAAESRAEKKAAKASKPEKEEAEPKPKTTRKPRAKAAAAVAEESETPEEKKAAPRRRRRPVPAEA